MSLKAKIEAVIYAAEEPVTLSQLAGLLGQEAQRELDALAAAQQQLDLREAVSAGETAELPAAAGSDEALNEKRSEAEPVIEPTEAPDGQPTEAPEGEPPMAATAEPDKRAQREAERRVREFLAAVVAELVRDYATSERGLELREVAGGLRMATKPEYHDAVRGFVRSLKPPLKLSLQALETLAVVAYKQPVTAPEVSEIRGVDSGGVLGSLITRKLVTTAGRKQVIGRPILYKTTKDFLLRFGLKDLAELPSIEEFEKMASELAEQEEIQMPETAFETSVDKADKRIAHENLEEEKDSTMPQADGDSDSLRSDNSTRADDELTTLDGRISIQPPNYEQPGDNPSAEEAAIQSEQEGA